MSRLASLAVGLAILTACEGDEPLERRPPTPLDLDLVGSLSGEVRLDGSPPPEGRVRVWGDAACPSDDGGTRAGDVRVREGRVANAIVWIAEGLGDRVFAVPSDPVVVDQEDRVFRPRVAAAQVGQEVLFENSDPTLHNVHTLPERNRAVNVGLPSRGSTKTLRFRREEVPIRVKCDVHPWMVGWVGVADHPYIAVTGEDGAFRFPSVPPGRYVVEAWHERFGRERRQVVLEAKGALELHFSYEASGPSAP